MEQDILPHDSDLHSDCDGILQDAGNTDADRWRHPNRNAASLGGSRYLDTLSNEEPICGTIDANWSAVSPSLNSSSVDLRLDHADGRELDCLD